MYAIYAEFIKGQCGHKVMLVRRGVLDTVTLRTFVLIYSRCMRCDRRA